MSRVSVAIERAVNAPTEAVARYISDFENAREWMVGIEDISRISESDYRLAIETPVGRLTPEARVTEAHSGLIRWVYTKSVDGDGEIRVEDSPAGCSVSYRGDFRVRGRILGRAAKLAEMDGFVRRQGERSLERLKLLMESGRYG